MERVKKLLTNRGHQPGFTILELLMLMIILGILAAVIIPNVSPFIKAGNLNAANTEVQNVRTAAQGYLAANSSWASDTETIAPYLSGPPKTAYTFNTANGLIDGVADTSGQPTDDTAWPGLHFDFADQMWEKN
jgi:type II secretory pathway pseudopilin PulG